MKIIRHCYISLDKILELTIKAGGKTFLDHSDGSPMTENEVYELVRQEKAKGYKYFCGCDNRDSEGRCAGHDPIPVP